MSLRLEMLQVARLAPRVLGDACERIVSFVSARQNPDGGFADRAGASDLYYTVFSLECLFALNAPLPDSSLAPFLEPFGDGRSLDLVHLSCLARCRAMMKKQWPIDEPTRQAMLGQLESFRSADGGYNATPHSAEGTLYGCFLATGACQDLGQTPPDAQRIIQCIASLKAADGGYANQRDAPIGLTPSTAAAVTLLRQFGERADLSAADWMLARQHPEGGFFATPAAPIPDLLSTATALHALSGLNLDPAPIREKTLDFIDTLWSSQGAFFGNWEDDCLDAEYTFYALLALGHLSV